MSDITETDSAEEPESTAVTESPEAAAPTGAGVGGDYPLDGYVPPKPHPVEAILSAWWNDLIPGSPVGHFTPGYNHLVIAFAELKKRLIAAL